MLCNRCLRRMVFARESLARPLASGRYFTNKGAVCSEPPLDPPAPASSTTPLISTPFADPPSISKPSDAKRPERRSKTAAGTVMKGLGYIKGRENVVAREDHEYPDWLWTLLDKEEEGKGKNREGGVDVDMFSKSQKRRREAAKAARKTALDPSSKIVKIPYDHQTIDLPAAGPQDERTELYAAGGERGWEKAQRARQELTHAMRSRRRKAIRESNFLKSMK